MLMPESRILLIFMVYFAESDEACWRCVARAGFDGWTDRSHVGCYARTCTYTLTNLASHFPRD